MDFEVQTKNTKEILKEAVEVSEDVTEGLKRSAQIVNDTALIQNSTLETLAVQGEQVQRIDKTLNEVDDEIETANELLYDLRCCLCCFCIPARYNPKKHQERKNKRIQNKVQNQNQISSSVPEKKIELSKAEVKKNKTKVTHRINSRDNDTEENAYETINEHKEVQDDLMDIISQGLDTLKQGARDIGEELERQEDAVSSTLSKAKNTESNVKGANKHIAFKRHL